MAPFPGRPMRMSTSPNEHTTLLAGALDALAATAAGTDAARERMAVALAASRLASAEADVAVLCLDRDCRAEAYSFEEAKEAADRRRRPSRDLLAAGLEPAPAKRSAKKDSKK